MSEMRLPLSDEGGDPVQEKCLVESCENTEVLWLIECVPGHGWVYVNGCGHWGFAYKKEK